MRNRTVIVAAGDFPQKGGEPWRLLASAERVIACDSAAMEYANRFRYIPDFAVGDFDSIASGDFLRKLEMYGCRIVRNGDQDSNDLEKAIAFCREQGWEDPIVVGATGRREDHTIGNVYRALAAQVKIVSDYGTFHPVRGKLRLKVAKGAGISVFASDPRTKMTSRGLKWKLDGVRFENPYCATLNRASSETVTVTSDRPAFVYVERDPKAVRAIVSLGSNLGNRAAYLRRATRALAAMPQTRLVDASEVIETEGVDVPDEFVEMRFLNQALILETTLEPLEFSRRMHAIEDRLGRVRTVRNGPRTIDIDLIDFGGVKMNTPELALPHPRARERDFVMRPLRSLGVGQI